MEAGAEEARYLSDLRILPHWYQEIYKDHTIIITRSKLTGTLTLNISPYPHTNITKRVQRLVRPNFIRIPDNDEIQIHFNHHIKDFIPYNGTFTTNHPLAVYKDKEYVLNLAYKIIKNK